MACAHQTSQDDQSVLYDRRAHQALPRLAPEEEVCSLHHMLWLKFHKYMYPYRYRRTKVGGLTDLVNVVNSSATVNTTQLIESAEGTVIVPT